MTWFLSWEAFVTFSSISILKLQNFMSLCRSSFIHRLGHSIFPFNLEIHAPQLWRIIFVNLCSVLSLPYGIPITWMFSLLDWSSHSFYLLSPTFHLSFVLFSGRQLSPQLYHSTLLSIFIVSHIFVVAFLWIFNSIFLFHRCSIYLSYFYWVGFLNIFLCFLHIFVSAEFICLFWSLYFC